MHVTASASVFIANVIMHSMCQLRFELLLILEKLEEETKKGDVRRQEDIKSLTQSLRVGRGSDLGGIVEMLQQRISEEDTRHKQMDDNLQKEKENNKILYEQYVKTLKELRNVHDQQIEYDKCLSEQLEIQRTLEEEKV